MKEKYFEVLESVSMPGKYYISPIHTKLHLEYTEGSFNVICARVLNMTYAQYLRLCRDWYNATIIGKNTKYPVAYFDNNYIMSQLLQLLNARAHAIVWTHDHPDWKEHSDELEKHKKRLEELQNVRNKGITR